jgi:hypothetical protein
MILFHFPGYKIRMYSRNTLRMKPLLIAASFRHKLMNVIRHHGQESILSFCSRGIVHLKNYGLGGILKCFHFFIMTAKVNERALPEKCSYIMVLIILDT